MQTKEMKAFVESDELPFNEAVSTPEQVEVPL